jgi:hypothetical protein
MAAFARGCSIFLYREKEFGNFWCGWISEFQGIHSYIWSTVINIYLASIYKAF